MEQSSDGEVERRNSKLKLQFIFIDWRKRVKLVHREEAILVVIVIYDIV